MRRWYLSLVVTTLLLPVPQASAEDTLSELKALKAAHRALLMRIEALEKKLEKEGGAESVLLPQPSEPIAEVTEPEAAEPSKGSLELKTAKTVLGVGGRIQLDAMYGWPEGDHSAGGIPMDSLGEKGQLSSTARDSRLWVKTRTPSRYGPIRALVETDFWGSSGTERTTNSHGPRLRHAYVEVGPWTAGQTNSVFNASVTLDTLYDSLDYTLVRQPLLRYSGDYGTWAYDISLEQPETTLIDPDGVIITPQDDTVPDAGVRVRYYPDWGEADIAAMVRYIRQDRALLSDGTRLQNSDRAVGWGLNSSAKVRIGMNDDIRFGIQYGDGIGRYVAYNAFAAGSIDANGAIALQEVYGGHLGYLHWWSEALRSTLAYSRVATNNSGTAPQATKESRSVQANLLWTPAKNMMVGAEYARALRELENGEEGEMELLRMTLRYDF